jgi:hypothetical protein
VSSLVVVERPGYELDAQNRREAFDHGGANALVGCVDADLSQAGRDPREQACGARRESRIGSES